MRAFPGRDGTDIPRAAVHEFLASNIEFCQFQGVLGPAGLHGPTTRSCSERHGFCLRVHQKWGSKCAVGVVSGPS